MAQRVHSGHMPTPPMGTFPLRGTDLPSTNGTTPTPPKSVKTSGNDLFNTSWLPEIPPPRPLPGYFGRDKDIVPSAQNDPRHPAHAGSWGVTSSLGSRPSRRDSPTNASSGAFMAADNMPITPSPISTAQSLSSPSFKVTSRVHSPSTSSASPYSPRLQPAASLPPATLPHPSSSWQARPTDSSFIAGSELFASPPTSPTKGFHAAYASPSTPAIHSPLRMGRSQDTPGTGSSTPASASKTSSFFASAAADTPPPAPRLAPAVAPSPLSLSRASSLRARALPVRTSQPSPPPLTPDDACEPYDECCDTHPPDGSNFSPLHQSPNLAPAKACLPRPPAADDVQLRLFPDESYLLGEGRHACVYLASYRRVATPGEKPTEWSLCAAKRLAADRESQTLGLREAFFLNRLGAPRKSLRPLSPEKDASRGRVYIVKLIGVKEDDDAESRLKTLHSRSVSDSVDSPSSPASGTATPTFINSSIPTGSPVRRVRSSTIFAGGRQEPQPPTESLSRLILVLEHAPLGTLDRLLRTSPALVGQQLWGRWARETAEALEWVHSRGVVHADMKPSNLLLTTDLHIRLSDFGSSLLIHPAHPPTDGVGLGTLPFSAPELVDPNAPFSFPVDIFALGATLYQCLTGREPYRGSRPVEMMHNVRNGGLWAWAERERLDMVGSTSTPSGSPYPSARAEEVIPSEMKRGGSLRARGPLDRSFDRPRLPRVGSAESLQAAEDVVSTTRDSPSGVKLWHQWAKGNPTPRVSRLLSDQFSPPTSPTPAPVSRSSSLRMQPGVSRSSSIRSLYKTSSSPTCPTSPVSHWPAENAPNYSDGSPAMFFLGENVRVPDDVRDVLRAMLDPDPTSRPTAAELVAAWEVLNVGGEEKEPTIEEERAAL